MRSSISFHKVTSNRVVCDNPIIESTVIGNINLKSIKEQAIKAYEDTKAKSVIGTLIRVNKYDHYQNDMNEYYIFYDGKSFKRKFNLFWDLGDIAEFLGTNRFEPVKSLREM